jgi:threonine dehydratase
MRSSAATELAPPPTLADVENAARRLEGVAVRTPLLESPLLNAQLGGRLLVKAESLQRTGSFKIRGAYNRLSCLEPAQRAVGVVAYSSGNHAQGVAHAAQLLGVPATIVMPADAPALKIANTRAYGAEVVLYDRYRESREAIGERLGRERGAVVVPPFDDPDIIAGQGTVGLEIVDQASAMGARLDAVLAAASGGGLVAGIALAVTAKSPGTKIYCAEPSALDDHARSLASGRRESNDPAARSICDALLAPTPGEITFAINSRRLAGGVVASDDEVKRAMAIAFQHFKLVVEPGGAVALAAVLHGRVAISGRTVAVVASGGNVDVATYRDALLTA